MTLMVWSWNTRLAGSLSTRGTAGQVNSWLELVCMTICSVQSIIDFEEHCNLIFDFGKQSEPRICVYTGIFIE